MHFSKQFEVTNLAGRPMARVKIKGFDVREGLGDLFSSFLLKDENNLFMCETVLVCPSFPGLYMYEYYFTTQTKVFVQILYYSISYY